MTHPFDRVELANGAQFLFTPCPGTQDVDLDTTVAQLKQAGAVAVISMTSDKELAQLNVPTLGEVIQAQGLQWFQLPVEDDGAPDQAFTEGFAAVKAEIQAIIDAQGTIVIHCRGGSGRTGLMAAVLLLDRGQPWAETKAFIQGFRPKALQIPAHLDFLAAQFSL